MQFQGCGVVFITPHPEEQFTNLLGVAQPGRARALEARDYWFDKFARSKFGRPQGGPKGGGQDARSNPVIQTNWKVHQR